VRLGTIAVRTYVAAKAVMSEAVQLSGNTMYPTIGPEFRFGAVLFVEKEGFDPLLEAARISERYDIGLMSTKGLSVGAARRLVDYLCGLGVKVMVLHDFDITGFKIFGTLGTDSKVYRFKNEVKLIDIGLRLKDAQRLGLQSEVIELKSSRDAHAATLRRHGATEEEIEFLMPEEPTVDNDNKRVELNAMTAPVFVSFLEEKFALHGIGKVVPTPEILEAQARRVLERDFTQKLINRSLANIQQQAGRVKLPKDLTKRVNALLDKQPELSWDMAIMKIIRR
jgi:hypothetical protein